MTPLPLPEAPNIDLVIWVTMFFTAVSVSLLLYAGIHIGLQWFFAYEDQYVQRTEQDLYGMFSNLSPQHVLQLSMACFVSGFMLGILFIGHFDTWFTILLSLTASTIIGFIFSFIPRFILKKAAAYRLHKFDLQLLESLTNMSNALKAGFSILQTFESVVQEGKNPIAQEFDLFLREVRVGVKFETAADNLGARIPTEDLQIVLAGIETARQTGGNLTEVFDRLAVIIRERMRVQGRIQSLTAQGRMQGWVVGMMPLLLGVAIYFISPVLMLNFIKSVPGILMILVMLMLVSIGFYLIRKIVNIDV